MLNSNLSDIARVALTSLGRFSMTERSYSHRPITNTDYIEDFKSEVSMRFRESSFDEISDLVDCFLNNQSKEYPWLSGAYIFSLLFSENKLEMDYFDAQPWVSESSTRAWHELVADVDEESLVAFHLARAFGIDGLEPHSVAKTTVEKMSNWGTLVRFERYSLRKRLQNGHGLNDLHVHLEGCAYSSVIWLEQMLKKANMNSFVENESEIVRFGHGRLLGSSSHQRRKILRAIHKTAKTDREYLIENLLKETLEEGPFKNSSRTTDHAMDFELKARQQERRLLIAGWSYLQNITSNPFYGTGTRSSGRHSQKVFGRNIDLKIAEAFDRYIFARNLHSSLSIHRAKDNPGLKRFRMYFDDLVLHRPRRKNRRKEAIRFAKLVHAGIEPVHLKTIQFRISPFHKVSDYGRFFNLLRHKNYGILNEKTFERRERLKIEFAIHFIRPSNLNKAVGGYQVNDIHSLRRKLAREALTLFSLLNAKSGDQVPITAIDVANLERGMEPQEYLPLVLFLKAGDEAISKIIDGDKIDACFSSWPIYLRRNNILNMKLREPLKILFHVGEDYAQPLTALRNIWEIVHYFPMKRGDRIGHALVLGHAKQFELGNWKWNYETTSAGQMLLDFVWVYTTLMTVNAGVKTHHSPEQKYTTVAA